MQVGRDDREKEKKCVGLKRRTHAPDCQRALGREGISQQRGKKETSVDKSPGLWTEVSPGETEGKDEKVVSRDKGSEEWDSNVAGEGNPRVSVERTPTEGFQRGRKGKQKIPKQKAHRKKFTKIILTSTQK